MSGETNRHGLPVPDAYTADLAATVFHLLGVGPDAQFRDAEGRPYHVHRGEPIASL